MILIPGNKIIHTYKTANDRPKNHFIIHDKRNGMLFNYLYKELSQFVKLFLLSSNNTKNVLNVIYLECKIEITIINLWIKFPFNPSNY